MSTVQLYQCYLTAESSRLTTLRRTEVVIAYLREKPRVEGTTVLVLVKTQFLLRYLEADRRAGCPDSSGSTVAVSWL